MSDLPFDDCCEGCQFIDGDGKEIEACRDMTKRCRGDSCDSCPPCKRFAASTGFVDGRSLGKMRPRAESGLNRPKNTRQEVLV
ncbi:MAG: hypothetical protein SA339_11980 [Methanomassiliicoccus sp.]|nr:hypothetical protein [Methanomassiliicoccus sp.]